MGPLWILRFWRELLIALLLGTTTTFCLLWSSAKDQIREVKVIERIANEQSQRNHEHLAAQIPVMLEQAQRAWSAAQARFPAAAPACPVAGGIRADSVLPDFRGGEDAAPRRNEPAEPQRLAVDPAFIQHCAEDAGYRDLFVRACLANPLICEFKE